MPLHSSIHPIDPGARPADPGGDTGPAAAPLDGARPVYPGGRRETAAAAPDRARRDRLPRHLPARAGLPARLALGLAALALLLACHGRGDAPAGAVPSSARAGDADLASILVSAAASLSEALEAIAVHFEAESGARVLLNVAGSQMLAAQIIEGAPVDVFISADVLQMQRAIDAGRIDAATRVDLLSNQLVVVVPSDRQGRVAAPEDLADPSIRRIALGDPEAVPAGVYARSYLRSAGIWESVAGKVVPASNVRAALRAVEAGTVDAGVVYRTDVRTSSSATVAFAVPVASAPPIVYPAAIAADAPNREGATRFLDYLGSRVALQWFEEAGFISLTAPVRNEPGDEDDAG